jgi:hypothetical protein
LERRRECLTKCPIFRVLGLSPQPGLVSREMMNFI